MLNWLKRTLRNWLLEEEDKSPQNPSPTLDCWTKGTDGTLVRSRFHATGVMGLRLHGTDGDGHERLLSEAEVCDAQHFWKLWRHLSGDPKLTWADGTPYDPTNSP